MQSVVVSRNGFTDYGYFFPEDFSREYPKTMQNLEIAFTAVTDFTAADFVAILLK
jgi:hypothetical protein